MNNISFEEDWDTNNYTNNKDWDITMAMLNK